MNTIFNSDDPDWSSYLSQAWYNVYKTEDGVEYGNLQKSRKEAQAYAVKDDTLIYRLKITLR